VVEDTQQQMASYFCLRTADDGWQFLGLDTGYNGHYMNVPPSAQQAVLERLHVGKVENSTTSDPHWPRAFNPYFSRAAGTDLPIQNPNIHDPTSPAPQVTLRPDEAAWHQDKLAKFPGRSILLSHHQLYSALQQCGVAQAQLPQSGDSSKPDPNDFNRTWINTGLWRQLGSAFGDKVAAWIWGHEHNLGIYQDNYRPADWPTTRLTLSRSSKHCPRAVAPATARFRCNRAKLHTRRSFECHSRVPISCSDSTTAGTTVDFNCWNLLAQASRGESVISRWPTQILFHRRSSWSRLNSALAESLKAF